MTHERTAIRYYLKNLLVDNVDVGGRVFVNRPSPIFVEELPLVNVFFTSEKPELWSGDDVIPHIYRRHLKCVIHVCVAQPVNDGPVNTVNTAEDEVDLLADQVERSLFDDRFFEKKLTGYDSSTRDNDGLLAGVILESVTPVIVDTESETRIVSQELVFNLLYYKSTQSTARTDPFLSYYMEINRDTEVDPILIAGDGDVRS